MKNERFEEDILLVPLHFPKLQVIEGTEEKFLIGELDIVDKDGKNWGTYSVEIKGSENYPFRFPKLFETRDAFPKIADWHVYELSDKSCCVDVTPNELITCLKGLNVIDFIKRFAIPYFANQTHRIKEGYYLYGEYSHGLSGRLEFYKNKLNAKTETEALEMLYFIIKGFNPDRRTYCPFCKKTKFRSCHRDRFRELSQISDYIREELLNILKMKEEILHL